MNSANTPPVYDAARVAELFGIPYRPEELVAFGRPSNPVEGYVTFFDPGWSLLDLRDAATLRKKGRIFWKQHWYNPEAFAQKQEQPRYRQLRMEPVPDSFRKTFVEQQKLLGRGQEVPTARVAVMGAVLHFLATGQRLFSSYWGRCIDLSADGSRVDVRYFEGGLSVDDGDDDPCGDVGLAALLKS